MKENIYAIVAMETGVAYVERNFSLFPDAISEGRLMSPLVFKTSVRCWPQNETTSSGLGNVILANGDGYLDGLIENKFVSVKIKRGSDILAFAYVSDVSFNKKNHLILQLKDALDVLDEPLQANVFPAQETVVIDGIAKINYFYAMEGLPRPFSLGPARQIEPVLVCRATNEYEVHDGDFHSVARVLDNGVEVPFTKTERGFTLASDPHGKVLATVRGALDSAGDFVIFFDNIIEYLFEKKSIDNYLASDLTQIQAAKNYRYSFYQNTSSNIKLMELVKWLCDSHCGYFYADEIGQIRFGFLREPQSPVFEIDERSVVGDINVFADKAENLTSILGANRNWDKYTEEQIAASVNEQTRQLLTADFRKKVSASTEFHSFYKDSEEPFDTLLTDKSQQEIDLVAQLYFKKRFFYAFDSIKAPEIGEAVSFKYPRFRLDGGKNLICVGKETDFINETHRITLWG